MSLDWSPASVVDGDLQRGEHDDYQGHCYKSCQSAVPVDANDGAGHAMGGMRRFCAPRRDC
jgi:hypothetical protein